MKEKEAQLAREVDELLNTGGIGDDEETPLGRAGSERPRPPWKQKPRRRNRPKRRETCLTRPHFTDPLRIAGPGRPGLQVISAHQVTELPSCRSQLSSLATDFHTGTVNNF